MKANAPEKLYLINDVDVVMLSYDPLTNLQGNRYDFVDKEVFPIEEGCEVEYTRTDAFLEKACEFMRKNIDKQLTIYHNNTWRKRDEFIENFRKYMKGE